MAAMYRKDHPLLFAIVCCCIISCNDNKGRSQKAGAIQPPINKVDMEKSSLSAPADRSPMDVSYYPADYPMQKMAGAPVNELVARVLYSRPQKNGRDIFVDTTINSNFIQHYGKEWRLGANEATEIEFFKDVSIRGKRFAKGRYVIYCIPYPDKWVIFFNSNLFSWGLHMDRSRNITSIELPTKGTTVITEYFSMIFQKALYGCNLIMAWGYVEVTMPIQL